MNDMSCNIATQNTKNRFWAVVALSAIDRWSQNDLTLGSVARQAYKLGIEVLKEDADARKDFSKWLLCKLGLN